jgi:lysozyme
MAWAGNLIETQQVGSGLVYKRNRYYDPASGRFTQVDPIGLAGGLNAYGFGGGDPVSYTDPFGLCPPCAMSQQGIEKLEEREGFRADVYTDPTGNKTVGYGHKVLAGEQFDKPMTKEEAEELLKSDVQKTVQPSLDKIKGDLTQNQVDAVGSLVFNIGGTKFAHSTLLKNLNSGNMKGASGEFVKWDKGKVNGKVVSLKGLASQRASEQAQFNSP